MVDGSTGERVELSVATTLNWTNKLANLFTLEWGLEPGETLAIDLPLHWQSLVTILGAWTAGLVVRPAHPAGAVTDARVASGAVVGPSGYRAGVLGPAAPGLQVLATALLPLGRAFAEGPPAGTTDFALEVPVQPDELVVPVSLRPEQAAWTDRTGSTHSHADLGARGSAVADALGLASQGRLLTDANDYTERVHGLSGLDLVLAPLLVGASLVVTRRADAVALTRLAEQERVSVTRVGQTSSSWDSPVS